MPFIPRVIHRLGMNDTVVIQGWCQALVSGVAQPG